MAKNICVAVAEDLHIVMGKPLDEVLDVVVTVDRTGKHVDAVLFLVLLWLLLGKLSKHWCGRFFQSTVWHTS